jgi:hypothetical protein
VRGALWDLDGNDRYCAQTFCQGAGAFGLGMILDNTGNDEYDCASLGQGGATTLGMGVDVRTEEGCQVSRSAPLSTGQQIPAGAGQAGRR